MVYHSVKPYMSHIKVLKQLPNDHQDLPKCWSDLLWARLDFFFISIFYIVM